MGPHWCPNMGNHPDTFPFGVGPRVRDSIGSPTRYLFCADKGHNRERSQGGGYKGVHMIKGMLLGGLIEER